MAARGVTLTAVLRQSSCRVVSAVSLSVLTIMISSGIVSASPWQSFAVFASDDTQISPQIHGGTIVWQQLIEFGGAYDWDIYAADITDPNDPSVFVVANYPNDETAPVVFDNFVAWQDNYYGDWDIYVRDISKADSTEVLITDLLFDQQKPVIYGNILLWQDNSASDTDVIAADITDPNDVTLFNLTPYAYDQQNAAIYRNTVLWQDNFVWEDSPDGEWNIFGADIIRMDKPVEYTLSVMPQDQQNAKISGDIIVWQQDFADDMDILAADISDPKNPRLIYIATDSDSSAINPDIDGNIIVWQDDRNGDWDIYGYNLTTQREFVITDNQPSQTTFSNQTSPSLSGNTVVWEDDIATATNIYATVLTGPEIASCPSPLPGDANGDCVVNLNDFALMAQSWLVCNLDDATACP